MRFYVAVMRDFLPWSHQPFEIDAVGQLQSNHSCYQLVSVVRKWFVGFVRVGEPPE